MERANKIIEWSNGTGRNPFDSAGIDSDDGEWVAENTRFHEYIESQINMKKEAVSKYYGTQWVSFSKELVDKADNEDNEDESLHTLTRQSNRSS